MNKDLISERFIVHINDLKRYTAEFNIQTKI